MSWKLQTFVVDSENDVLLVVFQGVFAFSWRGGLFGTWMGYVCIVCAVFMNWSCFFMSVGNLDKRFVMIRVSLPGLMDVFGKNPTASLPGHRRTDFFQTLQDDNLLWSYRSEACSCWTLLLCSPAVFERTFSVLLAPWSRKNITACQFHTLLQNRSQSIFKQDCSSIEWH